MQIRSLAAASVAATLLASPLARADEDAARQCASTVSTAICAETPRDQFRSEAQLRGVVENIFRYRIARIAVDGGCYSVLASDRNGTPYEVRFRGSDLKMVSRTVAKEARVNTVASDQ